MTREKALVSILCIVLIVAGIATIVVGGEKQDAFIDGNATIYYTTKYNKITLNGTVYEDYTYYLDGIYQAKSSYPIKESYILANSETVRVVTTTYAILDYTKAFAWAFSASFPVTKIQLSGVDFTSRETTIRTPMSVAFGVFTIITGAAIFFVIIRKDDA